MASVRGSSNASEICTRTLRRLLRLTVIYRAVPIKCSIRQGCPLSMQLFALCLDPLLTTLENMLTGIHTDCHGSRLPDTDPCAGRSFVLFYCRFYFGYVLRGRHKKCDVIFVSENSCLDRATASPWDTSINVTDIPYHTEMKILGIYFTNTVASPPLIAVTQRREGFAPWHVARTRANYAWTNGFSMSIIIC